MEIKPHRQPEEKLLSSSSGDRPFIWFSLLDLNNTSGKENRRSIHWNVMHCHKQIMEGPPYKRRALRPHPANQ